MNRADIVKLLTLAATYDYRRLGDADVEAWHLALDDLPLDEAQQAVVAYYRESTDRIMPAHVRQGVRALRAARRQQEPHPIRALSSRFDRDPGEQVQVARGAATVRKVLDPVLERIAEQSANQPAAQSAVEQLRAITPGPGWTDLGWTAVGGTVYLRPVDDGAIEGEVVE